jgi:SAM-dependent methyltransferase
MTVPTQKRTEIDALLSGAWRLEEAERPDAALVQAWDALDREPEDLGAKRLVTRLLRRYPDRATAASRVRLERLLRDPDIDPSAVSTAAWALLIAEGKLSGGMTPEAVAASLETDSLALLLLTEGCVSVLDAEVALTDVRRSLLLSGAWAEYPRLAEALTLQAAHNGGAWPFDPEEGATLQRAAGSPFSAAYLPPRPPMPAGESFDDEVTQAVADQYVRWPYPVWSGVTSPEPTTVPRLVEKLDGGRPSGLPVQAQVLIAGCGTGHEAALVARRFPDARITAIDISAGALAYAERRCAGLGIDFRLLDLHEVGRLGCRFDLITCSGVLHHLPDPEAGWAKLAQVLNPGGVMKVMLYSRVARLRVEAAKAVIADLRDQPVDDDLLRAARRRLIDEAPGFVAGSADFYSLGGVHDLLFNRREDTFDIPRIARALNRLQLTLLAFKLPTAADQARYRRNHPEDPLFRDVDAWGALEKTRPFLFSGMYEFWCRGDAAGKSADA